MSNNPTVILHTDNPQPSREVLEHYHPDLNIHTCDSYEGLPELIKTTQAEVVYSLRFQYAIAFPRATLVESDTVKWVSVAGSGTDHLRPWNPDTVTVTNAAGVAADMIAEYVLAGMLHFSLGLDNLRREQQRHNWIIGQVQPIQGKTVLIIGLGKTGSAVAARCKAMGMQTLGVRARPQATPNVDQVSGMDALPELLPQADFVVLSVPLLDSTRGMLGAQAFAAMKPGVVIVDVSRGGVMQADALIAALDSGKVRGAALDVFETEPLPTDSPFWDYDNVIVSPHCSAVYPGWDLRSVQMFAENLTRYRQGENLQNIVNPVRGY